MANGGAFGNPLTTGIALNFEVDMTPYRQMMQDNLQFAQTQAAERKKKQKEFQDILKNITYDDSKILKRRRDGARVQYAELISDAMKLHKSGDLAGIQNRIAEFTSGMNNLVDEKTKFNAYEDAVGEGKHWGNVGYIEAMNSPNEGETSDANIISKYSDYASYDPENQVFDMQAVPKADPISWANKVMQSMPLKSLESIKPEFIPETGEYRFDLSRVEDPEAFYEEMGKLWIGGGDSNNMTMKEMMGLSSDDLDGTGLLDNSIEFMRSIFKNKIGGERFSKKPVPKTTKPSYGFGDDAIGDVGFSGTTPSTVSTEAPTQAQKDQALNEAVTGSIQQYLDAAKAADPNNIEDELSKKITDGFLSLYELKMLVSGRRSAFGKEEVAIKTGGGDNLAFLDPTSPTFVQDLTDIVIEKGSNINEIEITPETTVTEFLTPESDAFTIQIAGGKTPKTDWKFPGGTTVVLAGDEGAVEVKLNNDVTLQGGKFQESAKFKDKNGQEDTYYNIMFPIEYQGNEGLYSDFFGDADALSQFKLKNRDQLPKSMYVKEDENMFNTLLTTVQTRDTRGKMNKSVLQKAMDKFMKPLSATGTSSAPSNPFAQP
jgi:hypothetical protein